MRRPLIVVFKSLPGGIGTAAAGVVARCLLAVCRVREVVSMIPAL